MKKILRNKKGFTFTEVMFVGIISVIVIGGILSAWIFTYRTWTVERQYTELRIDLMNALEVIKNDLRLSSLTYMSFYPNTEQTYTAVSMPVAETDSNGFFTLDADEKIDWDKTVIYYLHTAGDGSKTLRRKVFDPRDNTKDEDERYAQLEDVVTGEEGEEFLKNVDTFEISPLSPIVDFYDESSTPVRVGKMVFGWANLSSGDHTIRFEIDGKNDLSSGYDIGLDSIFIEPSVSPREVEYYNSSFAPAGSLTVSGGTAGRVHDSMWGNDNYLEFDAAGVGSYIEISDYYDLWRESSFEDAALDNTAMFDEEVHIKLDTPEEGSTDPVEITWFAHVETGDTQTEGRNGGFPGGATSPLTIRTVVIQDNISVEGDMIRVSFRSSSNNPLVIDKAYITKRSGTSGGVGLANQDPSGKEIEEYHRHQQLFFEDAGGDINEGVTISADSEEWSVWTAFPLKADSDYLISLHISDPASVDCKYWDGSAGTDRTYYIDSTSCTADYTTDTFTATAHGLSDNDRVAIGGGTIPGGLTNQLANLAGTPDCQSAVEDGGSYYAVNVTADTFQVSASSGGSAIDFTSDGSNVAFKDCSSSILSADADVYITANIDTWRKTGTVESGIFDTTLANPSYNEIKWSESRPEGTDILLKARSSDDEDMEGATDWDSISGSNVNPHSLSIGSGRYVQFLAELSTDLYWETSSSTLGYADYVEDQVALSVYEFPEDGSGELYTTDIYSTWIDDVEIDWPGEERLCAITGYIARKSSYGQAEVTVDGLYLLKILSMYIKVSDVVQDKTVVEENFIEIEPRNTGK